MSDHLPHLLPGREPTLTASAAVVGGQTIVITGNMTGAPAAGVSALFIGVAGRDAANGATFPCYTGGVHDLQATGAIAAGEHVTTAAGGTVATIGAGTFQNDIGIALEAIANGAKGRIKLHRG